MRAMPSTTPTNNAKTATRTVTETAQNILTVISPQCFAYVVEFVGSKSGSDVAINS